MVVVLHSEDVHEAFVRRAGEHVVEHSSSDEGQRGIHFSRFRGIELTTEVVAVLQNLCDFFLSAGIQNLFHARLRQEHIFHGANSGRNRQIIGVFDLLFQNTPSLSKQFLCNRSRSLSFFQSY